jgi:hypothetical protein
LYAGIEKWCWWCQVPNVVTQNTSHNQRGTKVKNHKPHGDTDNAASYLESHTLDYKRAYQGVGVGEWDDMRIQHYV